MPGQDPAARARGRLAPTRAGLGLLAVSGGLFTTGWAVGYPEPVSLGVAGFLTLAVAALWTLPAPGVTAHRRVDPPRAERGRGTTATVTLTPTGRRVRRGLRLADSCGGTGIDVPLPADTRPERTVRYRVPTPHRGRITAGPLHIVAVDPFGLCRRVHRFGAEETVVVRPRTVPLPVPASGRDPHLDGTASNAVDSAPSAFHALRAYVPGDDRRLVHWRSTARTGTLIVRQMADVSRPHTTVLLDTEQTHYAWPSGPEAHSRPDTAFELAVDICASVACEAARRGFPVRVQAGTSRLPIGAMPDADAVLDALAVVRPESADAARTGSAAKGNAFQGSAAKGRTGGAIADALAALARTRAGGSLVIVTGTRTDTSPAELVAPVRQAFDQVVVVRADTPGGEPNTPLKAGSSAIMTVVDIDDLPGVWGRTGAK
ncbi:DUF58 domain-containing protein [Yinghuangia sp. YIM S09857]|uniref:DUF58 domain-containing protein n=1 Tax=Yinghuangia sp. YIM S09857 TaxID=3436929 RepID=UPI003F52C44E